jgi:hypothetical protein
LLLFGAAATDDDVVALAFLSFKCSVYFLPSVLLLAAARPETVVFLLLLVVTFVDDEDEDEEA